MANTFKPSSNPEERRKSMGNDSIWRLLRRFSGPAVISMSVASSYNLIDAVFVGRLGAPALAAMGVTFPLMLSFVAIASGTAVGVTSLISRSLGAGNAETANRTAATAISLSFILSGIIAAACAPHLDSILRALGANAVVLPYAMDYMSIIVKFVIFSYLSLIMGNIIRADGNPLFTSSVAITSSLCNIILDPILIFGLGPVPAMGIAGAATATVLAQFLSVTVFAVYIFSKKTNFRFRGVYFIPKLDIVARIYQVGIASIVRSGAQFLVMGVINKTAASFGVMPLAIIGVLVRIWRFALMPLLGLGQGMLPLIGYNFGAGRKKRVSELVFNASLLGSAWTVFCWLILMLFPAGIMSIFSDDPNFIQSGVKAVRFYFALTFLLGIQMIPGFFFQGLGRGLPSTIISASRHVLFLLPLVLCLPLLLGLNGLWIAFPLADFFVFTLGLIWMRIEYRKQSLAIR